MKLRIDQIIEGVIIGLITAGISYLANRLLADNINLPFIFVGFLIGVLITGILIKLYGRIPIPNIFDYPDAIESVLAAVASQSLDAYKVDAIRSIMPTLHIKLSGENVYQIISTFSLDAYIVDALSELSPWIRRPLSTQAVTRILSKISLDIYKAEASSILLRG